MDPKYICHPARHSVDARAQIKITTENDLVSSLGGSQSNVLYKNKQLKAKRRLFNTISSSPDTKARSRMGQSIFKLMKENEDRMTNYYN
jgi:hypothetical protein